jgi:hypothetical protein
MAEFSLEATRPSAAEIGETAGLLGLACSLYLSSVPSQPLAELANTAVLVRRAGLEPVVHLPAPLRGLMSGAASGLLGHVDPGRIVEALVSADNAEGALGEFTLHYFSFGGLVPTARYAHDKTADLAARRSVKCRAMTGSN